MCVRERERERERERGYYNILCKLIVSRVQYCLIQYLQICIFCEEDDWLLFNFLHFFSQPLAYVSIDMEMR